jgi:hypothetical protein
VKQQFTGSYTLDVASRTIVLSGIEIPPERLAVVINSTVGYVYHNIEHEPTASVTASGNVTTIVFPAYKDCHAHQNTDSLSIFYDDGVDLGRLIKDESDETQGILSSIESELEKANATLAAFKVEAKSESDETQGLLSEIEVELNSANATLTEFKTEAKTESDELQTLLGSKLPTFIEGMVPIEFLGMLEPSNDVDVGYVLGGYGPSQIVFSKGGVTLKTLNLTYGTSGGSLGKVISITPAP